MPTANHEIISINPDLNMRYSIVSMNNVYTAMHWHDSIEILYILEGDMEITLNSEKYHLQINDYTVIDRKVVHATQTKHHSKYLLIQIPYAFLKQFIKDIDSIRITCICSLKQKDNREILNSMRETLKQLSNLYNHQYDGYTMEYYSLLFHFLHLLMTHYKMDISNQEHSKTEKYIERLSLITEYVQDHYQDTITLSEAAQVLSINPEYFSRFFKKYMGVTFLEYVYSIRLQAAYQDIINTDISIQEVQDRNGFTNPKIFSRMFKEQYGTTPRQIRKSILSRSRS